MNLEHLKIGDRVATDCGGGWSSNWQILTITGETKTRWKTGVAPHQTEWRKSDGYKVGRSAWEYSKIQEITDELRATIAESQADQKHAALWREIQSIKRPHHLSVSELEEIVTKLRKAD